MYEAGTGERGQGRMVCMKPEQEKEDKGMVCMKPEQEKFDKEDGLYERR